MREEIKSVFLQPRFWISVFFMMLCLFAFSIPSRLADQASGLISAEYYPSALQYAMSGLYFGGFMLLLPFCAACAYAGSQATEITTSFMYWKAIRGSIKKYCMQKVAAVSLGGGLSLSLGFILHAAFWNVIALPVNPAKYDAHILPFDGLLYDGMYRVLGGMPIYGYLALAICISGALWAMIGLATAVWIPDQLIVITAPVAINYFWSYGLFQILFGLDLTAPSQLYNDGLTLNTLTQALVTHAAFFLIAVLVYYAGMKRRLRYG